MTKLTRIFLPVVAFATFACSQSKQPIAGKVAQATFSQPVSRVKATRPDGQTVETVVAPDGSFTIALPPAQSYRLELLDDTGTSSLVFPRSGRALEWRFDVQSGGPLFDIGNVRHVGDPSGMSVTFAHRSHVDGGVGHQSECEDGREPGSGAVCVDDTDDEEHGAACGTWGHRGHGHHHGGKACADDIDAGDIDAGASCHERHEHQGCRGDVDGGLDCQDDDGDDDDELTGELPPSNAAVADRNLPAALGSCGRSDDDHRGRR